ncbi:hypothetical protein [Pelosinus propionicus]|uniref:Uncharacterized protein n=1 Tax=Pelosinus propionicus DSM 13327 TaxID=1123291 RepID=A0A1I4LRM1_9FIRM|nr:hypothetical protein [Pelosinus propionicus]SFL93599.1 hypothetical protein SAMN04490355_102658 [Pelosinus propionicus DSM 13327]
MIDSKVIEAFHLMWGNFPEPVQLTHKNREIIALNAACQKFGRTEGMKCSTHGAPEAHKGCLANQALDTQQPTFKKIKFGEREIITYWLPIEGYPELFIHFSVGVTTDYNTTPENVLTMK